MMELVISMGNFLWRLRLDGISPNAWVELELISHVGLVVGDFKIFKFCNKIDVQV